MGIQDHSSTALFCGGRSNMTRLPVFCDLWLPLYDLFVPSLPDRFYFKPCVFNMVLTFQRGAVRIHFVRHWAFAISRLQHGLDVSARCKLNSCCTPLGVRDFTSFTWSGRLIAVQLEFILYATGRSRVELCIWDMIQFQRC